MSKTVFSDGNASTGMLGTIITANYLNSVNNHRHTGRDIDGEGALDFGLTAGTGNAYTLTLPTSLDTYITGMPFYAIADRANTGEATLAVNGLTAKPIKKNVSDALSTGDIPMGGLLLLIYNGTNFILINPAFLIPAGSVIGTFNDTIPVGFLELNGASLSQSTYATLFTVYGTKYGSAGTGLFNLPDTRGQFLRGWAHGQSTDPDRTARTNRGDGTTGDNVGTLQGGDVGPHTHPTIDYNHPHADDTGHINGYRYHSYSILTNTNPNSGTETRPVNINIMWCVKY